MENTSKLWQIEKAMRPYRGNSWIAYLPQGTLWFRTKEKATLFRDAWKSEHEKALAEGRVK